MALARITDARQADSGTTGNASVKNIKTLKRANINFEKKNQNVNIIYPKIAPITQITTLSKTLNNKS